MRLSPTPRHRIAARPSKLLKAVEVGSPSRAVQFQLRGCRTSHPQLRGRSSVNRQAVGTTVLFRDGAALGVRPCAKG